MKRFTSLMLLATIAFTLNFSTPIHAMAANETTLPMSIENTSDDVVPYGSLYGYNNRWHNPSVHGDSGQFDINVTGSNWINAHCTISFENFSADTRISIWFWAPANSNGQRQLLYKTSEPARVGDWSFDNKLFNLGVTGIYTIQYKIESGNCPGRINCWIY